MTCHLCETYDLAPDAREWLHSDDGEHFARRVGYSVTGLHRVMLALRNVASR